MKYPEKEFTNDLKNTIKRKEIKLKSLMEKLLDENKPAFIKKGLVLEASFDREGSDPFQPGYISSISFGITDENGELIDLHTIGIWECDRYFLGMHISSNIPGSKVVGELVDETVDSIRIELQEYISEQLSLSVQ